MLLRITTLLMLVSLSVRPVAQIIPWTLDQWEINAQGYVLDQFQGEEALYLKNGLVLIKNGDYENFRLDFDIYLQKRRSFSGMVFRVADNRNYEEIYFRGHLSGMPDAMQYTPVFHGNSSWQLYHSQAQPIFDGSIDWMVDTTHGYNTKFFYPFGSWMHVTLEVKGTRAKLFLDDSLVLTIHELKSGIPKGTIGFKSGRGAVHFANVAIQELPSESGSEIQEPAQQGYIANWEISQAVSDTTLPMQLTSDLLKSLTWDELASEQNGLANISKIRTRDRILNTVLARYQIESDGSKIVPFRLGYSDRVTVFLNGEKLYSGNNAYQSRDYRFLGTIGLFDELYLNLQPGLNDLILAVTENFGGWGIIGKLQTDQQKSNLKIN